MLTSVEHFLAWVGAGALGIFTVSCAQAFYLYQRDRTGLSGRFGREQDNRRIDRPGEPHA